MLKHKPIQLRSELHARGERVELPVEVTTRWAWWVASELVRRHPTQLRVVEAHPANYDCISVITMKPSPTPDSFLVHLNLGGHITTVESGALADLDRRFNWYEVMKAHDRREYVIKQIEGSVGLRRVNTTPRTSKRSIGPRCLARLAESFAGNSEGWTIRAGFGFDSYWPELYRADLFGAFPDISVEALRGGDIPDASRFWFIIDPTDRVVAAIDTEAGLGWGYSDDRITLLDVYRSERRDLGRVLAHLMPMYSSFATGADDMDEVEDVGARRRERQHG